MFTRSKARALEAMALEIARQFGDLGRLDNVGDGESVILFGETVTVNLAELADALLAELEIEVEWTE